MIVGKYILIVLASVNFSNGGVALSTAEFNTSMTCEAAREKVIATLKVTTNYGAVTAVCVKK